MLDQGLGTAETAPRLDESGDVVIEYTGGGACNTRGDHGEEWSTRGEDLEDGVMEEVGVQEVVEVVLEMVGMEEVDLEEEVL